MTALRDYFVIVTYRGRVHELLAKASTTGAALDIALKERRSLRDAVRRHEASYEVSSYRGRP